MTDFDPNTVPIRAAATVMLISDAPELKVLMMRRHANTVFAGGMWVFPGGAVDPEDAQTPTAGVIETAYPGPIIDNTLNAHRAYYVAAIRECFEEAGILITRPVSKTTSPNDLTPDRQQAARDQVNAGELSFQDFLGSAELLADTDQLKPVARWITPLGSPKRFDARFFLATCPPDQISSHDAGELVDSAWMQPKDILDRFEAGELSIMTPTLRMIQNLTPFQNSAAVVSALGSLTEYDQVKVDPESRALLMPGELGYDAAADNIETGWVRLKPQ